MILITYAVSMVVLCGLLYLDSKRIERETAEQIRREADRLAERVERQYRKGGHK